MKNIQILQFIIVCLTFVSTVVTGILSYLVQRDKKKISDLESHIDKLEESSSHLSRKLARSIKNLQQYYELEKVMAVEKKMTHKKYQQYMIGMKIRIDRKGFSPRELEHLLDELNA